MKRPLLWLIGLASLISPLIIQAGSAKAHSLDQYVQATYISITPTQMSVELDLTPGALVAPPILAQLDSNGDKQITDAEGHAYAAFVLKQITLEVDGLPYSLNVTRIDMPTYLVLQAGYGTLRIFTQTSLPAGLVGTHRLSYRYGYQPTGSLYQINAFLDDTKQVTLGTQNRDAIQQNMTMDFTITSRATTDSTPTTMTPTTTIIPATNTNTQIGVSSGASDGVRQLFGFLSAPSLSVWVFALSLGLALLLGGLHALTPGHGKTLIAAYLVGNRGTARDAVVLGGIVTFTHTISVIVIGVLALVASQFIVPSVLVPMLEIASGLLVLVLGLRLLWVRLHAARNGGQSHTHFAPTDTIHMSDLWAMGISGGLVPCPEALGVLLLAVGFNRIGLGLAVIVAFSVGVAAVIIGIGLLLVRSRRLLDRVGRRGRRWQRGLPLISAVVVTLLGAGMIVKSLITYPIGQYGLYVIGVLAMGAIVAFVVRPLSVRTRLEPALRPTPRTVHNAPMAAAPLRYAADGQVAWDEMWTDFCDLALDGGPPHRGTLLETVAPGVNAADPGGYARVQDELERGLRLVTGLDVVRDTSPGWIGLICPTNAMAAWLARAIVEENVSAHAKDRILLVPVSPTFEVGKEIKNVITAVAKTHHYWQEHRLDVFRN